MAKKSEEYTRGQLAQKTSCNIETIRYYEKEKLLPKPKRSENGYRLYGHDSLKRLNFIRRCRELGFTVIEIKELLSLVDQNNFTCADISTITKSHIINVKKKVTDLQNILKALQKMTRQCGSGNSPECPILETLFSSSIR